MIRLRSAALTMSIPVLALGAGVTAVALAQGGEAGKRPQAIIADLQRDLAEVKSFHFAGSQTDKGGTVVKIAGDVFATGAANVAYRQGSVAVRMILVTKTKTLYLRGNAAFWKAAGGRQSGATLARRLADRWVAEPAKDGAALVAAFADFSPRRLARCVATGNGTLTKKGTRTVAGRRAVVIQDAGDKPGTTPGLLYVTSSGRVLPLRAVQTGPRRAGAKVNSCDDPSTTSTASDLSFSRFDKVPAVKAPHGAVSIKQLANGGSGTPV